MSLADRSVPFSPVHPDQRTIDDAFTDEWMESFVPWAEVTDLPDVDTSDPT